MPGFGEEDHGAGFLQFLELCLRQLHVVIVEILVVGAGEAEVVAQRGAYRGAVLLEQRCGLRFVGDVEQHTAVQSLLVAVVGVGDVGDGGAAHEVFLLQRRPFVREQRVVMASVAGLQPVGRSPVHREVLDAVGLKVAAGVASGFASNSELSSDTTSLFPEHALTVNTVPNNVIVNNNFFIDALL